MGFCLLLSLALPAHSQVSYTGTISAGFGDGFDIVPTAGLGSTTVFDPGQNGLPVCMFGAIPRSVLPSPTNLAPAINATIPISGTVMTSPVAAGQNKITVTLNNGGVAGAGGQTRVFNTSTCTLFIPGAFLPSFLTKRTQVGGADWPAASGVFSAGGGPGNAFAQGPAGASQFASIMAGPGTFGGGVPRTGNGKVTLGIVTPGLGVNVGSLPTGPQPLGGNGAGANGSTEIQNTGTFMNSLLNTTNFVQLSFLVFPWTTGDVVGFDSGGGFLTTRTAMGTDNRDTTGPNDGLGNIQLVSPFVAAIQGPAIATAPLIFSGVSVLSMDVPESGSIAMLSVGLLGLIGIHLTRRRNRATR